MLRMLCIASMYFLLTSKTSWFFHTDSWPYQEWMDGQDQHLILYGKYLGGRKWIQIPCQGGRRIWGTADGDFMRCLEDDTSKVSLGRDRIISIDGPITPTLGDLRSLWLRTTEPSHGSPSSKLPESNVPMASMTLITGMLQFRSQWSSLV